jgi:hypothetical protein
VDRTVPRRLILVAAFIAALALVGGVSIALSRGEDVDVGAGSPTTSGAVGAGMVPNGPVETGSTGSTGVVESSIDPVAEPRNVEVAFASGELVRIGWTVSKSGSPPVGFLVFRDNQREAFVTRPLFRDTDVAPGQRHEYRIVAVGEDGSTARSTRVVANLPSTQGPPEPPPTTDVVSEAPPPPPPPPDPCDGIVVGDDCI